MERARGANRPHAEGGQRCGNPSTPRAITAKMHTTKLLEKIIFFVKSLHISKKSSTFAPMLGKKSIIIILSVLACCACHRTSKVEERRAEKHAMDSVRLEEQVRSLAFYQSQLDSLMPVSDSLIALFTYEKDERYQDRGNYVLTGPKDIRILVKDDGKDILVYQEGQRLSSERVNELMDEGMNELMDRARHLQIVIHDIDELEKRITKTSWEVQKYQKRLQNN